MHEQLRIHHGIGSRVLLDSDKGPLTFTMKQQAEGYVFHVQTEKTPRIEEILRLRNEVNVFIFRVEDDGTAREKVWFYTGDGDIAYDEQAHGLVLHTGPSIVYRPEDYMHQ